MHLPTLTRAIFVGTMCDNAQMRLKGGHEPCSGNRWLHRATCSDMQRHKEHLARLHSTTLFRGALGVHFDGTLIAILARIVPDIILCKNRANCLFSLGMVLAISRLAVCKLGQIVNQASCQLQNEN